MLRLHEKLLPRIRFQSVPKQRVAHKTINQTPYLQQLTTVRKSRQKRKARSTIRNQWLTQSPKDRKIFKSKFSTRESSNNNSMQGKESIFREIRQQQQDGRYKKIRQPVIILNSEKQIDCIVKDLLHDSLSAYYRQEVDVSDTWKQNILPKLRTGNFNRQFRKSVQVQQGQYCDFEIPTPPIHPQELEKVSPQQCESPKTKEPLIFDLDMVDAQDSVRLIDQNICKMEQQFTRPIKGRFRKVSRGILDSYLQKFQQGEGSCNTTKSLSNQSSFRQRSWMQQNNCYEFKGQKDDIEMIRVLEEVNEIVQDIKKTDYFLLNKQQQSLQVKNNAKHDSNVQLAFSRAHCIDCVFQDINEVQYYKADQEMSLLMTKIDQIVKECQMVVEKLHPNFETPVKLQKLQSITRPYSVGKPPLQPNNLQLAQKRQIDHISRKLESQFKIRQLSSSGLVKSMQNLHVPTANSRTLKTERSRSQSNLRPLTSLDRKRKNDIVTSLRVF